MKNRHNGEELISILDEMAGAAISMHQGAQSYESFIKSRDLCMRKITESYEHLDRLSRAIENLHNMSMRSEDK